jgi:hypothetical protein
VTAAAWTVLAAGALAAAGCATADDGRGGAAPQGPTAAGSVSAPRSPGSPSSGSPSAPVASAGTPVPVTGPAQRLVTMTVGGGLAGVRQEVTVRGDGTVRTADRGRTTVRRAGAARFLRVRTLLGDPALAKVPAVTVDPHAADLFRYTVRFDGRTVVTDRSAPRPALDRLVDELNGWLRAG